MIQKKIFTLGLLAIMALFAATTVFADTNQTNQGGGPGGWQGQGAPRMQGGPRMMNGGPGGKGMMAKPAVVGKVESISGNTLTITSRGFGQNAATTTYSVDASHAIIFKANATSTLSSIATGDNVMVEGSVSGTNVTATTIRDGLGMMGRGGVLPEGFSGNGQPVVAGNVTAISGSTITISNESNVTYTVDATNAKVMKGRDAGVIGDVAAGDHLVVQGTVNGSSISATTIFDQKVPTGNGDNSNGQGDKNGGQIHPGFFGAIRGFFGKLFGF